MHIFPSHHHDGVLWSLLHCTVGMWSAHSTAKLADFNFRNLQTQVVMLFTHFCVDTLIHYQDEMNKFMSEHKTGRQCLSCAPQPHHCVSMGVAQLGFDDGFCLF